MELFLSFVCSLAPERSYIFFWLGSLTISDQLYPNRDWNYSKAELCTCTGLVSFQFIFIYRTLLYVCPELHLCPSSLMKVSIESSAQFLAYQLPPGKQCPPDFYLFPFLGPVILLYIGNSLMLSTEVFCILSSSEVVVEELIQIT